MIQDLKAGSSGYEIKPTEAEVHWTGAMDGNNCFSLLLGKLEDGNFLFFHVQQRGKLHQLANADTGCKIILGSESQGHSS